MKMPTYLDAILERKREDLITAKLATPLADLKARVAGLSQPLDFPAALRRPGVQVIAEIKKASPSRGVMAPELDPVETARAYAAGGAAAVSVLTEEPHFQGRLDFLPRIKAGLDGSTGPEGGPPLLRKDFILDPYQVYESRAYQADALLLIVAALGQEELCDLIGLSSELGLHCLVEVHDRPEVHRALEAGAQVIGINNRDLRTFETSLNTTRLVRPAVPEGRTVVSESGIGSREDVIHLAGWGVDAILVGEALVTAQDPGAELRALLGR